MTGWEIFLSLVVAGLIGLVLYSKLISLAGARSASMVFCVIPAATGFFAWLLLGDPVTVLTIVALVLGAVACALQVMALEDAERQASPLRRGSVEY